MIKCNIIGSGTFGKVYKTNNSDYVIKVTDKYYNPKKDKDYDYATGNLNETIFLSQFKHPNIISLKNATITNNNIKLKMPKYDCSLSEYLYETCNKIKYKDAKYIFYQMLLGLDFMNKNGLHHGDIKPGNILINKQTKEIRIIDFALSSFRMDKMYNGTCTYQYSPPEGWKKIIDNGVSMSFDTWSVAATMIEIVTKRYIVNYENDDKAYINFYKKLMTKDDKVKLSRGITKELEKVSVEFKDLICDMLVLDHKKRMTCTDVLNNKYFNDMKTKEINKSQIKQIEEITGKECNKFDNINRVKMIEYIYDICKDYDILKSFCLSVLILDRFQSMKGRKILNKQNYKLYSIASLVIVNGMLGSDNHNINWASKLLIEKNDNGELVENKLSEKLCRMIDSILKMFKYKMYYSTFDWDIINRYKSISYKAIKEVLLESDVINCSSRDLISRYEKFVNIKKLKNK